MILLDALSESHPLLVQYSTHSRYKIMHGAVRDMCGTK